MIFKSASTHRSTHRPWNTRSWEGITAKSSWSWGWKVASTWIPRSRWTIGASCSISCDCSLSTLNNHVKDESGARSNWVDLNITCRTTVTIVDSILCSCWGCISWDWSKTIRQNIFKSLSGEGCFFWRCHLSYCCGSTPVNSNGIVFLVIGKPGINCHKQVVSSSC